MRLLRAAFLQASRAAYAGLARPIIFRASAQEAHDRVIRLLRWSDGQRWLQPLWGASHRLAFPAEPVAVGGADLAGPLILAAGLVKGDGFDSEEAALAAVAAGRNIVPGWRSVPRLVGPVEFGSFTRWPRPGNSGVVLWRDAATRSTQNRVGLRNPGAAAAAAFLAAHKGDLPPQFGINVAVSPGVEDVDQQTEEVLAALAAFVTRGVWPTWFTLNLSCPNTEDDPHGHQTADQARRLCGAAAGYLETAAQTVGRAIPLWVKVGPSLGADQYRGLMGVLVEVGARAVVATNTLPRPAPDGGTVMAGVGGGRLHRQAVAAAAVLMDVKKARGYPVDVVGCGGVLDGETYRDFLNLGVRAVQYWTALVYRGPLAAALISAEGRAASRRGRRRRDP